MLLGRRRYCGNRYFDQCIRKCRRPSEIRVGAGVESVDRSFPSARVSPISQGCDDDPLHHVSTYFRNRFEATAVVKNPNGAALANIPGERIVWVDDHYLFAGVMQLSRQIAIAGIEERVHSSARSR